MLKNILFDVHPLRNVQYAFSRINFNQDITFAGFVDDLGANICPLNSTDHKGLPGICTPSFGLGGHSLGSNPLCYFIHQITHNHRKPLSRASGTP